MHVLMHSACLLLSQIPWFNQFLSLQDDSYLPLEVTVIMAILGIKSTKSCLYGGPRPRLLEHPPQKNFLMSASLNMNLDVNIENFGRLNMNLNVNFENIIFLWRPISSIYLGLHLCISLLFMI